MSTNLAESTTDSGQKYKLTFIQCGSNSNAVAFRTIPSTAEGNGFTTHRVYMANSTPPRGIPKPSITEEKVILLKILKNVLLKWRSEARISINALTKCALKLIKSLVYSNPGYKRITPNGVG
jgi:hypothetical protein